MKQLMWLLGLALLSLPDCLNARGSPDGRTRTTINDGWRFALGDEVEAWKPDFEGDRAEGGNGIVIPFGDRLDERLAGILIRRK